MDYKKIQQLHAAEKFSLLEYILQKEPDTFLKIVTVSGQIYNAKILNVGITKYNKDKIALFELYANTFYRIY